ncbi:microtubule-associated proteins 1A/1B light chain 3C [Exaiptasia diaphana]|uniref:Microtubule-associated proteins 1A/1B light chain 3C n=1 Tax=Exaiptasia diaphana TaxID=2652724 RepID=A0A913WP26_EXADI|nr:microtubule-associated proteins 1A/1B light chain 3C [Exaiptasia diaphana]
MNSRKTKSVRCIAKYSRASQKYTKLRRSAEQRKSVKSTALCFAIEIFVTCLLFIMGDNNVLSYKPFKQRKSFVSRRDEVAGIRAKFPSKVPVIVERYHKERDLPLLDKTKFLVPQELTMSQFVTIIRNRMSLSSTQAFYLIVNNKSLASMSMTMAELYREEKDEDGFLYMVYASQEMFGCNS